MPDHQPQTAYMKMLSQAEFSASFYPKVILQNSYNNLPLSKFHWVMFCFLTIKNVKSAFVQR